MIISVKKNTKKRKCKVCGYEGNEFEFWSNSNVCLSCMAEKKQHTRDKKNKLLAHKEIVQYVYIMFDKDNNVVYIGQTENMDTRMRSHCIFVSKEDVCTSICAKYEHTIIPQEHLPDIKRVKYAGITCRIIPDKELNNMGKDFNTRIEAIKKLNKLISQERIRHK